MRNYFTFNGKDSRDYGVWISGNGTYNAPVRQYENIAIPGRDGDLLGISTRLANADLTYKCGIVSSFQANLADLRSMLLSTIGYVQLTDSYHPDEYRLAVYKGGLEPDMVKNLVAGEFDLTFECKPQRYLLAGTLPVPIAASDSINNPTDFSSRPLIRVVGSGTLTVGDVVVTVAANSKSHIDIDAEMMDCYSDADNCNALVSFSGNDFPLLPPGTTGLAFSGLTSVTITPRWWRV